MTDFVEVSMPAQGPQGPQGAGYKASSSTSLPIASTGSAAFQVAAGLAYSTGARVRATSSGGGDWMEGVVSSYSGTTLTVAIDLASGGGTHADWTINLAGQRGAQGVPGAAGASYAATSVTSLACAGSGSKTFGTQTGLAYAPGARVRATSAGSGEWMEGVVSAYSGSALTVTMDSNSGTGTHADWTLNLAGQPGQTGASGAGYLTTSTTSLGCAGSGSKTFTVAAGLAWTAGARLRATSTGSGEWMEGVVSAYSGTSLSATMDLNSGTGTHADWDINVAGERGAQGAAGANGTGTGDMLAANNLSDVANVTTARGNLHAAYESRVISTAGLATGGGDLTADRIITVPKAAAGDVTTGTDDTKAVTPKALADAGIMPATAAWSTGDVKLTLKTTADAGWRLFDDGTIGDGSSGATYANAAAQALFTLLFNILSDTWAPLFTSAGASTTRSGQTDAATAWGNHCRMSLPKTLGRALAIAGAGSGLTARALGENLGEETHLLTTAEMPAHTHSINAEGSSPGGGPDMLTADGTSSPGPVSTTSAGGGGVHNNMQPTSFLNAMVKL